MVRGNQLNTLGRKMLARPNDLAAYLYLRQSPNMPEPILDEDGDIDVAADDAALEAWSKATENFGLEIPKLEIFIQRTEQLMDELVNLELDPSEPAPGQYMTLFYDAAKDTFDHDKTKLRTYFMWLYYVLYGRPEGSRWGDMVDVMTPKNFTDTLRTRFENLI